MPTVPVPPRVGSTFAQCLDNQWFPPEAIEHLVGSSFDVDSARQQQERVAQYELIRSLLFSRQLLIKREMLNNPLIHRPLLDRKQAKAFSDLWKSGDLLPVLFHFSNAEGTPPELRGQPEESIEHFLEYTHIIIEPQARTAWQQFIEWFPEHAEEGQFAKYARGTAETIKAVGHKFSMFARELGEEELKEDAIRMLRMIRGWKSKEADQEFLTFLRNSYRATINDLREGGQSLSRQSLYQSFLWDENFTKDTPVRPLDEEKLRTSFALELKQMFDTAYNAGLPNVLNRRLFVPTDSLNPLSLPQGIYTWTADSQQTWGQRALTEAMEQLVRKREFLLQWLCTEKMHIPDYSHMSLSDAAAVMNTQQYKEYAVNLEQFLESQTLERMHAHFSGLSHSLRGLLKEIERTSRPSIPMLAVNGFIITVGVGIAGMSLVPLDPSDSSLAVSGGIEVAKESISQVLRRVIGISGIAPATITVGTRFLRGRQSGDDVSQLLNFETTISQKLQLSDDDVSLLDEYVHDFDKCELPEDIARRHSARDSVC